MIQTELFIHVAVTWNNNHNQFVHLLQNGYVNEEITHLDWAERYLTESKTWSIDLENKMNIKILENILLNLENPITCDCFQLFKNGPIKMCDFDKPIPFQ